MKSYSPIFSVKTKKKSSLERLQAETRRLLGTSFDERASRRTTVKERTKEAKRAKQAEKKTPSKKSPNPKSLL